MLRGLNPLHHLPGVGTIYRAATGEEIHPVMRVAGAALLGGPLGMALAGVAAAIEAFQPGQRLAAHLRGLPDPELAESAPPAPRSVAEAYRRWGETGGVAAPRFLAAGASPRPG